MIKELIKIANRLDKLGLTKEADYLDRIIKSASSEGTLETADSPFTLDPIRSLILESDKEEVKSIFKNSCLETINLAKNIFKDLNIDLSLVHPRYSSFRMDDLERAYGEEMAEDFSMARQEYYPADFVSAAESILDDSSGRYSTSEKNKVKYLLKYFNNFMDKLFIYQKTSLL